MLLTPGTDINGYVIEEEVSRGAMAKSYRAVKGGRPVFLKLYLSPKPTVSWFRDYVAYQAELRRRIESSPLRGFTYQIIDFFEATRPPRHSPHSKLYYQVFEWVEGGEDLASIIAKIRRRRTAFTWEQRLTWGKVIAGTIAQFHSQRIVHSDLKPENLILFPDPTIKVGYRLKLIDMDFSLLADRRAPWHGDQGYVGTPGWFSPEHLRGEVPSAASDVFTCALILHELLAGGNPYAGLDDDAFKASALGHKAGLARLEGPVAGTDEKELLQILHRCLSPDSGDRPSIQELSETLNGRRGTAGRVPVPAPAPVPRPPHERVMAEPGPGGGAVLRRPAVPKPPVAAPRASDASPLTLAGAAAEMTMRITTRVTRYSVRSLGEGSEYWDKDEQFRLERRGKEWFLVPNTEVVHATLINGRVVTAATKLCSGDEIAVGKEASGVRKLPLIVRIAA